MIAVLLFAGLATVALGLLLARFAAPRAKAHHSQVPLRALTVELLQAMGFTVVGDAGGYLVAARSDPLGESRLVVVLSDDSLVDQAEVLAAAETVRAEGAARGMLITAGEIESDGLAGLELPIELVDGRRLRQLVAEHLPERLSLFESRPESFAGRPEQSFD